MASSWDEEEDLDFLPQESGEDEVPTARKRDFADMMALDDDEIHQDEAPAAVPTPDVSVNRPEYMVTDSVAYFNQAALMVLLYAHVSEGVGIPAVFNRDQQSMVTQDVRFDFQ